MSPPERWISIPKTDSFSQNRFLSPKHSHTLGKIVQCNLRVTRSAQASRAWIANLAINPYEETKINQC